MLINDPHDLK